MRPKYKLTAERKAKSKALAKKRSAASTTRRAKHIRTRKANAEARLAAAPKAKVKPPSGVWLHREKTHRQLRAECARLSEVAASHAETLGLAGDDLGGAYHRGREDAFLWAVSAMDTIEMIAKGRSKK